MISFQIPTFKLYIITRYNLDNERSWCAIAELIKRRFPFKISLLPKIDKFFFQFHFIIKTKKKKKKRFIPIKLDINCK